MISTRSRSSLVSWMSGSDCGAPLIRRTGISQKDPESEPGLA